MKLFRFILPLVCIIALLGLEVVRDMSFFYEVDSTDMAVLSSLSEEDSPGKENENKGSTFYEMDVDFEELAYLFFLRETVWFKILSAHDLSYQLLEQKVIIPPPEGLFS
ncbi:MAG: hypothetical protein HYZ14_04355 [Bacteroidetes bacterium]|nr:hypothetical protein [Bacteroidota bacterium]